MQFFSFRFILNRIKAIRSMMRDKTVPRRKKALVVFGLIYLVLPVDLIPPVLFPIGFLDDAGSVDLDHLASEGYAGSVLARRKGSGPIPPIFTDKDHRGRT